MMSCESLRAGPEESLPLGHAASTGLAWLARMLARDGAAVTAGVEVVPCILRDEHDTLSRVPLMRRLVTVNRSGGMAHGMY